MLTGLTQAQVPTQAPVTTAGGLQCISGLVVVAQDGLLGALSGQIVPVQGSPIAVRQVVGPAGGPIPLTQVSGSFATLCGQFTVERGRLLLNVTLVIPGQIPPAPPAPPVDNRLLILLLLLLLLRPGGIGSAGLGATGVGTAGVGTAGTGATGLGEQIGALLQSLVGSGGPLSGLLQSLGVQQR
jgi:hypothetical protein